MDRKQSAQSRPACVGLCALWLVILLVSTAILGTTNGVAAPSGQAKTYVPYHFAIEHIMNDSALSGTGDKIHVVRNVVVPEGKPLTLGGWLATPEGVDHYEAIWAPVGGVPADWQAVTSAEIFARPDLGNAGVLHASGHGSAGYQLSILPPEGAEAGYYDVYIRAVNGMGDACDLAALLNLRYGEPDLENGQTRRISFWRLLKEGDGILRGGATVSPAQGITLPAGGSIRLGQFNLGGFSQMRISFKAEAGALSAPLGKEALLGLKSTGEHPYGHMGDRYNMTGDIISLAPGSGSSEGELIFDLGETFYSGDVWLTGYLGAAVRIQSIEFVYAEYATNRVAAKLRMSTDLTSYFSGASHVELQDVEDPALGHVLRIRLTEDTNDPYIHFNAGQVLEDAGFCLSADDYKYMVILARALPENLKDFMSLYLCAGNITGATELCTHSFKVQTDGNWHYYLLDLTQTANWTGSINGWRFDIINGDSLAGNAVDFASVQFFRTPEAAAAAAAKDATGQDAFALGSPAVEPDYSEEKAPEPFTPAPEDTYVVTEPETEPVTEPETGSSDLIVAPVETTAAPIETTAAEPSTTETPGKRGCASSTSPSPAAVAVTVLVAAALTLAPLTRHRVKSFD